MDPIYWAALLSFIAGVCGYIIARFWIMPIGRYRRTKQQLLRELQSYLQTLPAEESIRLKPGTDTPHLLQIRQLGLKLVEVHNLELPYWYRLVLVTRKESPQEAFDPIQRLEKMPSVRQATQCIERIDRHLGTMRSAKS
ncbi:MAG: hypothetical protein HZB24_00430 [Desulfobacterales bacterium]|nr:hypothetical protein [Desulfobacterales bacterium]